MRTIRRTILSAVIASSIVAATPWLSAQGDGIKDMERFVKSGDIMSAAVADARLSAQGALDAHNLLIQGKSGNMKDDYKKVVSAESLMSRKVAEARKVVGDMDRQSASYFTARSNALGQIEDAALRDQAKNRLDASQKEYEAIRVQLRAASEALAPFSKSLSDQIRYLGVELTPGAAESLAPQTATLNVRGSEVFAQADTAVGAATQYFSALRPSR